MTGYGNIVQNIATVKKLLEKDSLSLIARFIVRVPVITYFDTK